MKEGDEMTEDIPQHDQIVATKIVKICNESTTKFEKALQEVDVLGIVDLYYDELISHMEDLVDELESSEVKAYILLYLIELKATMAQLRISTKAKMDFMNSKA